MQVLHLMMYLGKKVFSEVISCKTDNDSSKIRDRSGRNTDFIILKGGRNVIFINFTLTYVNYV